MRAGRLTAAKSGLAWAQRHAQGRRSAGTAGQAGSTRPPSLHPSPALRPPRPAGRAGLTLVRSPWLLADVAWDAARERAAAIWLARELGRPLRRLAAADFAAHSLQAGAACRLFKLRNAGGAEQLSMVSVMTCKSGCIVPHACQDGPHVGSRARVPRHALAARAVLTAARCAQGLLDARGPVEEVVERVAAALARTITRCPGSRPPVRPPRLGLEPRARPRGVKGFVCSMMRL